MPKRGSGHNIHVVQYWSLIAQLTISCDSPFILVNCLWLLIVAHDHSFTDVRLLALSASGVHPTDPDILQIFVFVDSIACDHIYWSHASLASAIRFCR